MPLGNQGEVQLNGTHQLVTDDDVLDRNINTMKSIKLLLDTSKEIGLEINVNQNTGSLKS
jgi:hypothetical protein